MSGVQPVRQYEYKSNSNLVLQPERTRGASDPSGEPESLHGKMGGTKFGDRAQATRPVKLQERIQKVAARRKVKEAKKAATAHDEEPIDIDSGVVYRPKTKETRTAYEALLNFLQTDMPDTPPDVLRGAADEVLTILKEENMKDPDKCKELTRLLPRLSSERFSMLVNLGKKITDFADARAVDETETTLDENHGISVVFNDDEDGPADGEDSDVGEVADSDSEKEEEDVAPMEEEQRPLQYHDDDDLDEEDVTEQLHPRDIDAFWLQREVSKFYADADTSLKISQQIMLSLQEADEREVENKLVDLLSHDKFPFIKLLMHNRLKITHCILLARAQTDGERRLIEDKMRADPQLSAILDELRGVVKEVRSREQVRNEARGKEAARDSRRARRTQQLQEDVLHAEAFGTSTEGAGPAQKQILDLESLSFSAGGHFMANRQCELPEKSKRINKKGYEEVHIPSPVPFVPNPSDLISIDRLPDFAKPAFSGLNSLNYVQSKVYPVALLSPHNLLLCAPTGSGKTNVAMLSMLNLIGQHQRTREEGGGYNLNAFKIVYVAPMKSLVQEMVSNFSTRLQSYGIIVRELTGDQNLTRAQISETQVIVTTPEKWDIITRKSGDRTYTQQVKLLIIDEVHLLHDDRGPVLESIIARTLRQIETTQELCRIVGLSATLPNYEDVARLLRVDMSVGLFHFDNTRRPVPLQQQYIGITEKKPLRRFQLMNEITYEKTIACAGKHQVLIFVHSRKETGKTARALRDMALENDSLGRFLQEDSAHREVLLAESEHAVNAELKDLLPYGFAIHHAGMTRADRTLVEALFDDHHIQVLVSTATLAWGVNLPAHTVIIKGTQIYSPEKGKWVELSPLDIMQMMGRAGRPQHDTFGEGIIITSHAELQYYLSLLNHQLPIESQYISRLADNLNAEIVLGTVQNIREAVDWLGYTYLYIRMMRAPSLYGVTRDAVENDPYLDKRRADLVHTAAVILDKNNLIKYDRRTGNFQVTDLGRVASHYYVTCASMSVYNEHLKPNMNDIELLRIFSLSHEFKYIPVREEEKVELQKLVEMVPIPVKESIEEPTAKVNVLLQAYISQLKLDGFALVSDMVYVQQSAGRLMRALFEIVLKRGWAVLALRALAFCKMIDKRMWSTQSFLRQFRTTVVDAVVRNLEKKDIEWERFFDMQPAELGELVRFPKMGRQLHRVIHQFPRLDLTAHVQPITRTVLRVELTITPDFQMDEKVHGPAEGFWVLVEDTDGEFILHSQYFILKAKYSTQPQVVNFTVPMFDPPPPQYFIRVVSDRWIGSESVLPISFRHLILSEKYPPHTQLLDLQPLPVHRLSRPQYEQIYYRMGLQCFNPIQSQVFSLAFGADSNLLIAAPTGSGKTICAEFAIIRAFTNAEPDQKIRVVYVTPLEPLAIERYLDWKEKFGSVDKTVVLLTGDTSLDLKLLDKGDIIISIPQHWDMLSRRWKQRARKNVQATNLFIMDELHLIGGEVGHTMEIIMSRMRYIAEETTNKIRIVALSSSLANAKDLGEWIGATQHCIFNFHPNVRPVPLEIHIQGFEIAHLSALMLAMSKPAYTAINRHGEQKPVIIFVPSRKLAAETALDLLSYATADNKTERFLPDHSPEAKEMMQQFIQTISDESLKHCLGLGVGFIHDHTSVHEREVVEKLFRAGSIQVLIATHSLCWGLTFNSHLVIIMGTQHYNGRDHCYVDYSIPVILQMMGRASRPTLDDCGRCVLFCLSSKKDFYKKFLYEPLPVESHLDHHLADHINAEIVTRTIEEKQDAVDYLTWTFFYRRLTQNPNYYNLQGTSHRHLSDHLSELVENTLETLETAKCISVEDMALSPLNMGVIASYYYIAYTTIELFALSLGAQTKLKGLVEILCAASEFDELPMRHHEERRLRDYAGRLPLKIDKPNYSDPHTKANVLLQAHFSRLALPHELAADQRVVVDQAHRLLQAMVDVISSNAYLHPALQAMELSQMVTQAMWTQKDSVFIQLPHVDAAAAKRCEDRGLESIFDLMELEPPEIQALLQVTQQQLSAVARACNRYPSIELQFNLPEAVDEGTQVTVDVELEREMDENAVELSPAIAPFLAKKKDEGWWLLIGDEKKNQLIATKRVSVERRARTKLEFPAPAAGTHTLSLLFMCDAYAGCDQRHEVTLTVRSK